MLNSVLARLAFTSDEFQKGHLTAYAPAKSLDQADCDAQSSWGPAMRR